MEQSSSFCISSVFAFSVLDSDGCSHLEVISVVLGMVLGLPTCSPGNLTTSPCSRWWCY